MTIIAVMTSGLSFLLRFFEFAMSVESFLAYGIYLPYNIIYDVPSVVKVL